MISWGSISSPLPFAPGPHTGAVEEAARLIGSAKRPAIIIGAGGNSSQEQSRRTTDQTLQSMWHTHLRHNKMHDVHHPPTIRTSKADQLGNSPFLP
ncbi:hypothetical protein PAAG_12527 [Paracoccidioides lutzii Pb01]|uniref:Uncharacterized protein n=1 Tax=Paracoccidioides lutzii (strain ATCC MYA-826 / Pb01) TaxID=502779 RepID=A0A0A2VIQ1_PARBA|nr:hypothetical protein PAAG_12527 [Paracoccidioides lutzii Pb01]KGQ00799.1 hypothetical protein PAAG_12527 [Paracoccidioides lutzii Pb01]